LNLHLKKGGERVSLHLLNALEDENGRKKERKKISLEALKMH
jgi:hypothetical protein